MADDPKNGNGISESEHHRAKQKLLPEWKPGMAPKDKPETWTLEQGIEYIKEIQKNHSRLPYFDRPEYEDGHPRKIHTIGHEGDGKGGVKQVFTYLDNTGSGHTRGDRDDIKNGIPITIGGRMRMVREDHGLKQVESGHLMTVSQSTTGAWESGDLYPKKELMNRFCRLFGVAESWLWLGDRAKEFESSTLMEMIRSRDKDHNTVAKIVALVSMMQGDRKEGQDVLENKEGFVLENQNPAPAVMVPGNTPGHPGGRDLFMAPQAGQSATAKTDGVAATGSIGEVGVVIKDIPLLGTAAAAGPEGPAFQFKDNREAIDYVPRAVGVSHVKELYAIEVVGDSMSPKHEDGHILICSIRRRALIGDTVIVQLFANPDDPNDEDIVAYVKVLAERTGEHVVLKQYHPEISTITVATKHIKYLDRVVPEQELLGFK